MNQIGIIGIAVNNRADRAAEVQDVITRFGDAIIARMGVPSPDRYTGIITVIMEAGVSEMEKMVADLSSIEGVVSNYCVLNK